MKAVVYRRYGAPDVLECREVEKPAPRDGEVLIRIVAASVNPMDWHFMRGTPRFIRLMSGFSKPKDVRMGRDVAGQVVSVGAGVAAFHPGDEVFGWCLGAFAEYACASESHLVAKPGNLTAEQAASVPVAALTALVGLRCKGFVPKGQKVLINGAAGGVGTFAVQIARSLGAHVTGVCSTRNVELVRSIGADRVVDYTREGFTEGTVRYGLILDCIGNHPLSAIRRILDPGGIYVIVGGPDGRWIGALSLLLKALALSPFVSQKLTTVSMKRGKDDLAALAALMATGKVTPVIDRRYPLHEVPEAIRYLEEGHARGKVVINME